MAVPAGTLIDPFLFYAPVSKTLTRRNRSQTDMILRGNESVACALLPQFPGAAPQRFAVVRRTFVPVERGRRAQAVAIDANRYIEKIEESIHLNCEQSIKKITPRWRKHPRFERQWCPS